MTTSDQVRKVILEAVEEFNDELEEDRKLQVSSETVLYGNEGKLDSVALLNLIVLAEEKVEDAFGTSITIANEQAMDMEKSPFETVASLSDYVADLVQEAQGG